MKIIETTQDENGIYFKVKIEDDKTFKLIKKGLNKYNKKMKSWRIEK
jgi:hypothetical protein